MARAGTRAQRVAERRQQILDAARGIAEADGWTAVTSRRLADAIGYTQPVLYGHFPGGKTEIMRTVALATHPSLYEAMFQLPIDARFAQDDAETELRSGFNALGAALGTDDDGTATELLWSALHGMSLLERAGRMRPEHRPNRIAELAARFANWYLFAFDERAAWTGVYSDAPSTPLRIEAAAWKGRPPRGPPARPAHPACS